MQISAFDLDHTLVKHNTNLLFYHYLIHKRFYRPISIFPALYYAMRYHFFNLSIQELHKKVFQYFLKGISLTSVQREVKLFLSQNFYRFLYCPALSRLRLAQHEGHYTIILSNSPSFLVAPIAYYLNVDEWRASIYSVDEEGRFTAIDSILLGKEKALYIQKLAKNFRVNIAQVTAYSDNIQDLPFLSVAGKAIVVNPNAKMKKIAQKKSWEVI